MANPTPMTTNTRRGVLSALADIAAVTLMFFFTTLDQDIRNLIDHQGDYVIQVLRALGVTGPLAAFTSHLKSPAVTHNPKPVEQTQSVSNNPLPPNGDRLNENSPTQDANEHKVMSHSGYSPIATDQKRPSPPRGEGKNSYAKDTFNEAQRLERIAISQRPQSVSIPLHPNAKNFRYSASSKAELALAATPLQVAFITLLPRSPYDIKIFQTAREWEEQVEFFKSGVSKTTNSRHLERPAHAVDFYLLDPVTGELMTMHPSLGVEVVAAQKAAYVEVLQVLILICDELGTPITTGGLDWGWDYFHVQLSRKHFPRVASLADGKNIDEYLS